MKVKPFSGFPGVIFLIVLVSVTLFFGYILKPFFFALFWAVLLAAVFDPLNARLNRRFKSPGLCAGVTLAAVMLTLVLPVGLILALLIGESVDLYTSITSNSNSWIASITGLLKSIGEHPLVSRLHIDEKFITDKSIELIKAVADFLVKNLSTLTENTVLFLIQFAIMLYCLFYFLRDGRRFIDTVSGYLPVDRRHIDMFISEFLVTAKATLKFTFVIGGIQGLLGGLVFYFTGIERPLVWGVLMMGLSIVPAVGNAIIWAPAGVIMLFLGHIWQGIAILVFGSVVISTVDNLLRPVLMGKDIEMHALLIFLSTLGGIAVFGFSGFVLGPVIAAFFLASWNLFLDIYLEEKVSAADDGDPT